VEEELAIILKEEIKFGGGSSQILPRPDSSFDTIDKIAKCLIKYPELRLFFDGHTACMPCKGDCEALKLSQDRCDSIEAALRDRNVSNVFTTKGWGCKHPTVGCQKLVRIHVDKEQTASAVQQSTSNALSKASSPAGVQSNAAAAVICPSVNPAAASAAPPDPAVQSKLEAAKKAIAVALSEKIQFYWKGNVGSNIKPESQPIVDKVAAVLMQYPDLAINIQGHTACEHYKRGAPCGLLDLAEERAAAVVAALKQKGCANEFSTKAWGCLHPDVGGQMLVSIFPYSQAQAQAAAAAVQQQTAAATATLNTSQSITTASTNSFSSASSQFNQFQISNYQNLVI
jgi:outer membrane protein OmpA-like peptidoglycan-associated protein